ncbi:hypothetical protein C8R43DRAFT_1089814 [Mycena crocata]|nr:hypothetical protein C8R43DRAFT_1089814 [Mycena crocata]
MEVDTEQGYLAAEESIGHILLECTTPGQSETWALAEELWLLNHETWPALSMGSVMGCGLATFRTGDDKLAPSDDRLYRMIVSESIFFIWKLRCDRVIKYEGLKLYSPQEVRNRWIALINEKLHIDRALTNRVKFGRQHAVDPQIVLDTWKGSLFEEEKLPDNWLRAPEVLVGVVSRRSNRSPSPPFSRDPWPD